MSENIGVATLALTQGIASFTYFLPKLTDVRRATQRDPEAVADIRTGEAGGVVVAFGVGMVCSALTKSALPAAVSLVTAAMIVCLYESVLRAEPVSSSVVGTDGNVLRIR